MVHYLNDLELWRRQGEEYLRKAKYERSIRPPAYERPRGSVRLLRIGRLNRADVA